MQGKDVRHPAGGGQKIIKTSPAGHEQVVVSHDADHDAGDVDAAEDGVLNWAGGEHTMTPTVDPDLIYPITLDPASNASKGVTGVDKKEDWGPDNPKTQEYAKWAKELGQHQVKIAHRENLKQEKKIGESTRRKLPDAAIGRNPNNAAEVVTVVDDWGGRNDPKEKDKEGPLTKAQTEYGDKFAGNMNVLGKKGKLYGGTGSVKTSPKARRTAAIIGHPQNDAEPNIAATDSGEYAESMRQFHRR